MEEENIIHGPKDFDNFSRDSIGKQIYESLLRNRNLPNAFTDAVTGTTLSYKTILEKSCRLAESLRKCGIKQNDVIGVFSENSLEYFYPVVAALYLGCIVTTFNPQYTSGEILHTTDISKAVVIFCSKITVNSLIEVSSRIKSLHKIVVMDSQGEHEGCESLEEFISNNSNPNSEVTGFKPVALDVKEQVAFILYSSGTTGLPKGVMLTHNNTNSRLTTARNPNYSKQYIPGENVAIGLLPFFHAYGLLVVLICLIHETIQNYKIKTLHLVPPLVNFLAQNPLVDNYNLSHVEMIHCAAAPLSKRTQEVVMKRLGNVKMFSQGYGLTETTIGVLGLPLGVNRSGSCGKVLPNVSAKVLNIETGKSLGPHQEGELCFKGEMIMKGYAGDDKATKETIDKSGWLHTGDVGYYDEDGFFYIVDRIKELIKYKGYQVPPAELEAILLTHPKIGDVGVVGLPDESAGELPVAFVVTEPELTLTEKEVQDFVAKKVSPQKRLRGGVRFVDEIPKNPSGKILRRVLRQLLVKPKSKL